MQFETCFFSESYKHIKSKTTRKWSFDKQLSSIDMKNFLELLANKELRKCILECDAKNVCRYNTTEKNFISAFT